MKKLFVLLVALAGLVYACTKADVQKVLGANANISSVDLAVDTAGNFTLTISGSGFSNAAGLSGTFNGQKLNIQVANSTQIVATISPNSANTTGMLVLNVPGQATADSFPYNLSMDSMFLSPYLSGGTGALLTLIGSGFASYLIGQTVTVGGMTFTIDSASGNKIVAVNNSFTPPAGPIGSVSLGVGALKLHKPFLLGITSISPATGPAGTPVTINGYGFNPASRLNVVKFNGVPAQIASGTSTSLNVLAPQNGTTGVVSVASSGYSTFGPVYTYPTVVNTTPVSTYAGTGSSGAANGPGSSATFTSPENGIFDNQGNMYVADYGSNQIRKIDPQGNVTTLAGSTTAGYADGKGTAARFNAPSGLALDPQGNLYVSDELNHMIRKVAPDGTVTTIAGTGQIGFHDAPGTSAAFNRPIGLALDSLTYLLYVADSRNNAIRTIDLLHSNNVQTIAGTGQPGSADDNQHNPSLATFNSPRGLAINIQNSGSSEMVTLFIADYGNNKIRKLIVLSGSVAVFTYSGDPNNLAGSNLSPSTYYGPNSLSIGYMGGFPALFIADASNHMVRYISDPVNQTVGSALILTGQPGVPGLTNGTLSQATFRYPDGVAYNPADQNLYVIEFGNNDIRKVLLH